MSPLNYRHAIPPTNGLRLIGVIMEVHEYENAYYQVKDDVLESLPTEEE